MSVRGFTRSDLQESIRVHVTDIMKGRLADLIDLRSQVKQAHWNVRGNNFMTCHLMFEEMVVELDKYIDLLAERSTTLGCTAHGTVQMAAEASQLEDLPIEERLDKRLIFLLANRYAQIAKSIRKDIKSSQKIGDEVSADLFVQIAGHLDLKLWFLESHLEDELNKP